MFEFLQFCFEVILLNAFFTFVLNITDFVTPNRSLVFIFRLKLALRYKRLKYLSNGNERNCINTLWTRSNPIIWSLGRIDKTRCTKLI